MKIVSQGFFILLAVAAPSLLHADVPAPPDVIPYYTHAGDTLSEIAQRYLAHVSDYAVLQKQNHLRLARRLQPKTRIWMPRALLKFIPTTATVLAFRGQVLVDGRLPTVGASLSEGAQVVTGSASFATLSLSNGSQISLPSNSRVRLSRLRRIVMDKSIDYEVDLEDGRLQTKAAHFTDPFSRYQVQTPLATSAVRGTEFRAAYGGTSAGSSLTEVLDGTVAVSAKAALVPVLVPKLEGIGVALSGAVHVEALLAAPTVLNAAELQKSELVTLQLSPVKGAVAYHVQLANDGGFVDIFADAKGAQPLITFANVPDGHPFVRTTAISTDGFEGVGAVAAITRLLNSVTGEAKSDDDGFHFRWVALGSGAHHYRFQLTQKPGATPLIDEPNLSGNELTTSHLASGTYYWGVESTVAGQDGSSDTWSDFEKFSFTAQ